MSGRAVLRNVAVVVLALIAIFYSVSDIVVPWRPYDAFGFVLSRNGTVVDVTPKSHVDDAGIRVGDRVDLGALAPVQRAAFNGRVLLWGGGAHSARLEMIAPSGARRTVTIEVDVRPRTLAENLTDVIQCLSYFVSIVLAAGLVMLRPGRLTWSFFVFVILSTTVSVTPLTFGILPVSLGTATLGFLANFSWIPLAIFALRFPHDAPGRVARLIERALLVPLVVVVPLLLFKLMSVVFADRVSVGLLSGVRLVTVLPPFGLLLTIVIFAIGYRAAVPADRTRMHWVIAGFVAGYSGLVGRGFLIATTHDIRSTLWLNNLLASAPIFATIAVTYAIVRHRVLDVRIVVRRAAIYAILTTTVVALIAVMDFLVGKVFEGTKIAAIGEVGIAVILGLTLNPLHRRLESAVDAAIFRRRRAGEERLRLVADGLLHAHSAQTISRLLVKESIEAFSLASGALFEANDTGDYTLAEGIDWDDAALRQIEHESSLALRLIAAATPLRLTPADLAALPGAPVDSQAPALAVPIVFRGELDGFILFGAHRSGEEIDAEEIASLTALARAAASAYDHLDAQSMRARLAVFEAADLPEAVELAHPSRASG